MPMGRSSVPCVNCRAELSAPTCTSSRPRPALIDGTTTGKSCWNQWMKKWPPVMTERNLTRSAPMARTAPRSAALFNSGFLRRAARAREVFRLDFFRIEFRRRLVHALDRLVEIERRGVLRAEAQRIEARDDEAPEIRARHAARFERLDFLHDEVVERHQRLGARGADYQRRLERLLEELVDALEQRCVRAAAEARALLVADAERDVAGLLEFQRVARLGRVVEARELARHADDFERLLAQVVRLLGIEREDLIRGGLLRHEDRRDAFGAERAHRREAVMAVGRPVERAVFGFLRAHGDDRIEKAPQLADDIFQPAPRRGGKIATIGRWLRLIG